MLLIAMAAALTFVTPPGWQTARPASSMRVAEFTLPKVADDAEDAQLVVYYFGAAGGGGVEANIERWVGQMQQTGGTASDAVAKRTTRKVNGLAVTLVDVSGTYVAEMTPGAAARNNKPNFRLRAGVVETSNGPYYIKLTGPEKTVAKWDQAFEQFVGSLKYQ